MKKVLIFSALLVLASVSLSAQVVKGAGLWYFNGLPNVTPSVATGTEIAYSINNKALFKWNRTTSAWVAVVQDSSITNELQDLILSNDTLSLTLSDSIVLMAQYRNHVWEIANLSDTTSITGDIEGDVAYTSAGDTIAFRGASAWIPFTGGGGGGTFNSFNIAGDTGSDIVTDGQTVTYAGGFGINTVISGNTITHAADTSELVTQSDIVGFGTTYENIDLSANAERTRTAMAGNSFFYKYTAGASANLIVVQPYNDGKGNLIQLTKNDDFRRIQKMESAYVIDAKNKTSSTGSIVDDPTGGVNYFTTIGATMTVTFTGTDIWFQHYADANGGIWKFVLDGDATDTLRVDTYTSPAVVNNRVLLFDSLTNTPHTVVGTLVGANPSSGGNRGWYYNYTGSNNLTLNSTFLVAQSAVCDLTIPIDTLQSGTSNIEFALNIKPADCPGCVSEWVPFHGINTALYTGDSLKVYADGVQVITSTASDTYAEAGYLNFSQELNGYYKDSIVVGKEYLHIYVNHTFTPSKMNVSGRVEFERNTALSGYLMMFPFRNSEFDTLITGMNDRYGLDITDGSEEDIAENRTNSQFLAYSNTQPVRILIKVNGGGIKRSTATDVRNPLYFIQHRVDAVTQKLYTASYDGATIGAGTTDYFNYDITMYKESPSRGGFVPETAPDAVVQLLENSLITQNGDTTQFGNTTSVTAGNPLTENRFAGLGNKTLIFGDATSAEVLKLDGANDKVIVKAPNTTNTLTAFEVNNTSASIFRVRNDGLVNIGPSLVGGTFTGRLYVEPAADTRLASIGYFDFFAGTTSGFNGQGFNAAGFNRTLKIYTGDNNTVGDTESMLFNFSNALARTVGTNWTGFRFTGTISNTSTLKGFDFMALTPTYSKTTPVDSVGAILYEPVFVSVPTKEYGIRITRPLAMSGFGTKYPQKTITMSDGIDRFSMSVASDKMTFWNDVSTPVVIAELDSVGVFNATTGFQVAGAATSGSYLRGNGINIVLSTIQAGDVPALNYLPLTLTGTTEVNTAGNILRIRDAADYPEMYMNGTYWLAASSALNYIDVGSDLDTTKIVTDRAIILNTNGNIDAIGDTLNIDANGGYGHVRMTGNLGIGDITNGDGITIAAYAAGNILTSVTIDGTGNSGLLFDDGALTLSNNISEVADTVTRTLGTGQQIYANGYAAYSGSGFTYSSGRITNGSGASRLCKIRYYFTAETAGLLTDALTVRVMIWDGATYNEHRPGRLTMTLNDDWELTGAKETIITLPDGDGVNIAFDSTDGLDVSNFGYVIEKI